MPETGPADTRRLTVLDSLRGVAAIFVALHNLRYPAGAFIEHSSLFVDFFFVLSGFVISRSYARRLGGAADLAVFVLRRAGRLLPLHVAMLLVFIALDLVKLGVGEGRAGAFQVAPFTSPNTVATIWQNLLLVQALGRDTQLSWNVPSWSISVEFWTYLLFGAIVVLHRGRLPSRWLMGGVAAAAAVGVVLLCPHYLVSNTEFPLLRCVLSFVIGHLAWRAWVPDARRSMASRWLELPGTALVLAFVALAQGPWTMAAPLVFGFAVWVFAYGGGRISGLLGWRPLVLLGNWSYSIYMVQWLVRIGVVRMVRLTGAGFPASAHGDTPWEGGGNHWQMAIVLIAYLGAVVVLAAITFHWIEMPARRYVRGI